jgi:hypothetical protein
MTQKITKLLHLKTWVSQQIKATPIDNFPITATFNEAIEEPEYTITIQVKQPDFYVDAKGTKWVREK